MLKTNSLPSILFAGLVLFGCARNDTPPAPPTVTEIMSPAGMDSEEPNLSVGPDGRVYMTWMEPTSEGFKLMFSVRDANAVWSEPRMIAAGDNWFVNDADFPSMTVLSDGALAAHWLGNNEPGTEAYDVNISISHDGGATWGKPIVPHRDKTVSQHGFVALVPGAGGRLNVIWLDGRTTNEGEGDMALMHTTVEADGTLGPESTLDMRVCECCQTSAAATSDGLLVVYRDRTEEEIRDISVVRYAGGAWSQPEPLNKDGWEINACPVNGPAISSNGEHAAAAWFTGAGDKLRVYAVMSNDSGKTFGKPVQVDEGQPDGRVDVLSLPSGGALVTWTERTNQGAQIRIREIDPNGLARPSAVVSGASGVRSGAFARLERAGDQAIVAWTGGGDIPRVTAATVDFDK